MVGGMRYKESKEEEEGLFQPFVRGRINWEGQSHALEREQGGVPVHLPRICL